MADQTDKSALMPAERMALMIARARSGRGDDVEPNTSTVLVLTVDRLADRVEALEAALRPFAAIDLGLATPDWEDDDPLHVGYAGGFDRQHFIVGDVRRARALLEGDAR